MTLQEFFREISLSLNEETLKYINGLNEVDLKLLVKRVYENNVLVKNELNKQIKLTEFKSVPDLVSSFDRGETIKFILWLSENVFGSNSTIEEELEKILLK